MSAVSRAIKLPGMAKYLFKHFIKLHISLGNW
jgi:hypothetical protein